MHATYSLSRQMWFLQLFASCVEPRVCSSHAPALVWQEHLWIPVPPPPSIFVLPPSPQPLLPAEPNPVQPPPDTMHEGPGRHGAEATQSRVSGAGFGSVHKLSATTL